MEIALYNYPWTFVKRPVGQLVVKDIVETFIIGAVKLVVPSVNIVHLPPVPV
ncbi:hypothetical protein SAMN05428988_4617 [Chitinophaga sp. YR573]|nr:hypothetical protein SAMN05428988_4617 [Chitinophaga sp. YR573]